MGEIESQVLQLERLQLPRKASPRLGGRFDGLVKPLRTFVGRPERFTPTSESLATECACMQQKLLQQILSSLELTIGFINL